MRDPNTILERLIRRDRAVREGGQIPTPRAESEIIDFIAQHGLYENEASRRWMVERATTESYPVARSLVDILVPLIQQGFHSDALAIFCGLIPQGDAKETSKQRASFLGRHSRFQPRIKEIVETPGLISGQFDSWGVVLIELESKLLNADQSERSWHQHSAGDIEANREPDYEDYQQQMYFEREHRHHESLYVIAHAIDQGLKEAIRQPTRDAFETLTNKLISTRWGFAKSQPIVAFVDLAKAIPLGVWQREEAVRLLTMQMVLESPTANRWRRLLRRIVLPVITSAQCELLASAIRQFVRRPNTRLNELSDLAETGVLTDQERTSLASAREANEVSEPYDLRELHKSRRAGRCFGESSTDTFVNSWPIEEERSGIRALIERKDPSPNITLHELETPFLERLDTLRKITERILAERSYGFGEICEWCADAISDLKLWLKMTVNQAYSVSDYLDALREKCSWWQSCAEVALNRLQEPVPSTHLEQEGGAFCYDSGDPIAVSLKLLDELLAVEDDPELVGYAQRLYPVVRDTWDKWPAHTRGLAIWLLRPYHWRSSSMTGLLVQVAEEATDSQLIGLALDRLLQRGQPGITKLLSQLIERIDELSDPNETAQLIGNVIGDAVIRFRAGGENLDDLRTISEWFDSLKEQKRQALEVRRALITAILSAAERTVSLCEKRTKSLAVEWLSIVNWVVNEWLDSDPDRKDMRHLPNDPIRFIGECAWSVEVVQFLLTGFEETLVKIIREGGLGEFYSIHYELIDPVENKYVVAELNDSKRPVISFMSDAQRLQLCRASAERVAAWRREGKATNDLAYGSSVGGRDTQHLIENSFDYASDRNFVRRELASIVEILADAQLRQVANELRIKLRRSVLAPNVAG